MFAMLQSAPIIKVLLDAPKESLWRQLDFYVALGTALLAVWTAVLAWMTKNLVDETKQARLSSEAASVKLLLDAERSATASERSAESARRLVEVGQSPWIAIKYTSATFVNNSLVFTFKLWNYGRTPACEVISQFDYLISSLPFPRIPNEPRYSQMTQPIPPDGDAEVLQDIPAAVYLDKKLGESLYVYGRIIYQDFFSVTHRTEWSSRCILRQDNIFEFVLTERPDNMT